MIRLPLAALTLASALALAACDSAEERAEAYFQSALALIEANDLDRALVELRNVLDLDGRHVEGRTLLADTLLTRGEVQQAYRQYLRVAEQSPDLAEVRIVLAELAMSQAAWDEVERHGQAAIELAPEDPRTEALAAAIDYRAAILAEDDAAKEAAAGRARAALETTPDNEVARRVVIDHLLTGEDPQSALPEIDRLLAERPEALELQFARLRLLAEAEDSAGVGAQLDQMFALFPQNEEVQQALIGFHLSQRDFERTEEVLRELAAQADDPVAGNLTVVEFLAQAHGREAARAELERLVAAASEAEDPAGDLYRALIAGMEFEAGERDAAIAEMEAILEAAPETDQTRRIQVMLARMLSATGDEVGARARVEEVIEADPGNVEALKMRAAWHIRGDRPGEAIADLRAALAQAPRDADIMTLMAEAHERDGSLELAGERLALAVEVSNSAPAEAIRYARYLLARDRAETARQVLTEARRRAPQNLELLGLLADLALAGQDWSSVADLLETLEIIGTDEATAMADRLRAARLFGQERYDETVATLERQIAAGGDDAARATAMLVAARIEAGDVEGARAALDAALAERPDEEGLKLLSARLDAATGDLEAAEAQLRDIMAGTPGHEVAAAQLYQLLQVQERPDEAEAVLQAALEAAPSSTALRMMQAGTLERQGDIAGAIAIYEALYAEDSSNVVVANNLASLVGTHVDDEAELTRVAAIARRLRGREIPAFQDTYGWIEYRRGNHETALENLEPAAEGLPDDPLVQYHLGMTYAALGRTEEARATLERALEIAGESDLPQFETARETLAGLPAEDGEDGEAGEEAGDEGAGQAAETAPAE